MLEKAHTVHCGLPAVVAFQIEGHKFQVRDIGSRIGEHRLDAVGAGEIAHAAAHGITGIEQLESDMAAQKAGYAGEKNAIGHGFYPTD